MQLRTGQIVCSPSDLANFVACEHSTQLDLDVGLGKSTRPSFGNAYADLIKRKVQEHEQAFLNALGVAGRDVTPIGLTEERDFAAAARATTDAMYAGSEYIYQAVFLTEGWNGIADFLERIDRPSALGPWSYRVLDTKLARHPRPEHALQLCFYSYALGQIQKIEPEFAYVILGTREPSPVRLADVSAYFRRLRRRFESAVADCSRTVPYPCEHASRRRASWVWIRRIQRTLELVYVYVPDLVRCPLSRDELRGDAVEGGTITAGLPKPTALPWLSLLGSRKPERKINLPYCLGTIFCRKIKQGSRDIFIALHVVFQGRSVYVAANQLSMLKRSVGA
jgi:hypothetical protein